MKHEVEFEYILTAVMLKDTQSLLYNKPTKPNSSFH